MKQLLTNPRLITLLIALITVAGLSALSALPRDEDPRIANRHAFVMTTFPGASAQRVEALVTEPLESELRELPEIQHIDSRSSAGFSSLTIELADTVAMEQTDAMWAKIRDKLEQIRPLLPASAGKPVLEERRSYPFTLIVALTWAFEPVDADMRVLGRYAEELASRLRSLAGSDYIGIRGAPAEEVVVDVDPAKAALLGFSPHAIGTRVFQADAKVSAGEIHNSRMRMAVEVEGALDTLERIRQIPLRQTAEGSAVLVGDLAEVSRRTKTPASDVAIIDGQQAVVVGIRMLPDQRSDRWSAEVGAALAEFQQQLPANVVIKTIFDQEHYTSARLNQLTNNIVLGFGLIAVVLLFTLGWRAALMVAAALPLMVLFTFACMNFTGLPIHQMSVTGLIVALGIMVDNAIVMVDTVNRFKQQGIAGLRATQAALNHLWMPLLGSTVTTMLAFMPIIVMPGGAGEFTGAISLTVVFSLLGSYLISHCVVAGFAGRFLVVDRRSGWWHNGVQLPQWSSRFRQTIDWAISHPRQLIAGVTLLPLLGFILGSMLPEQFFPPADRDMINLEVFLPAAVGIEQTINLTEKISEVIKAEQSVKSLHWFIGNNAPAYYYNLGQGRDDSQYYAQAMLTVDHFSDADYLVPTLQRQLDDQFPEAQIIIRRLEQGPPFGAPVEIRIVGAELETLKELGNTLRRRALAIEDVVHARATLSEAVPKIWLAVNENQARAGNLSLTDIAGQLQQSVDGAIAGSVLEGTQSLPVRVQAKGQKQLDAGAVHSWLLLPGASESSAEPIPYAALGDISIRPQQGVIPRRDGERINTIQLYIRDGVLPAVVLHRLQQSLAETPQDLPLGYRLEFAGEDEKRAETVNKLVSSMGIIVLLLIVSVVMSFNSFRLSAIVFIVAIQSAGLGMLALSFSGQPFGFTAIIGLMGLIGLAINAAIVILAELKSDCEAVAGNKTAVINGVMNCSRHIVSTTTTTVVGFIPLILSGGAFWPPFAFVIAGGTFLATLLSFYFVPVMFCAMTRRRNFELTGLPQALIG